MSNHLTIRSDADRIAAYILGKEATLSEALQLKLQRLERVADLISSKGGQRVVAKEIVKLWPEYSPATAYRMIGEAQEIFTPQLQHDRAMYVDNLIADIKSNRAKAQAAQDLKTVASCDRQMADVIERFMGTNEAMPLDKLQPPRLFFGYLPELAGTKLPDNLDQVVANIVRTRKLGVVANHADFEDAKILDETTTPGPA